MIAFGVPFIANPDLPNAIAVTRPSTNLMHRLSMELVRRDITLTRRWRERRHDGDSLPSN
jgi:2,4-dienoyl-CoA reductase-like NADH-dependent reductase (Old Yellow Enzyme family)